jgi:hypothetical protein
MTPAECRYAVHEQELLALVEMIKHNRPYLLGRRFRALTDHKSLTWLNMQPHLSRRQARWIELLQEYDIEIEYIPGKWNSVADILSRRPDLAPRCIKCRQPVVDNNEIELRIDQPNIEESIRKSLPSDDYALQIIDDLQSAKNGSRIKRYSYENDLLRYVDRLYVPDIEDIRLQILHDCHDASISGHQGWLRTYERISRNYYWPKMEKDVKSYVSTCDSCQRNKPSNHRPFGLLHPLPIPSRRWSDIAMDFSDAPLTEQGHDAIVVFVDRLTKRVILVPTEKSATALDTARIFIDNVFRHHGLPDRIVSDRDSRFTSHFWRSVMDRLECKTQIATARHQETDGQSERTIRTIKEMLRAFLDYNMTNWDRDLALAEFAYNDSASTSTGFTPFYLDVGQHPRLPITPINAPDNTPSAIELTDHISSILAVARDRLRSAQDHQAEYADRHRLPAPNFQPGDLVLLDRSGITLDTDANRPSSKLLSKWLGPFEILHLGDTPETYQLKLPQTLAIHPIFHVNILKPYRQPTSCFANRDTPSHPEPSDIDIDGTPMFEVDRILAERTRRNRTEYLTLWQGYPPEDATWEPEDNVLHTDAYTDYIQHRSTIPLKTRRRRRV